MVSERSEGHEVSKAVLFNDRGNYLVGAEIALSTRKNVKIPNERRKLRPPKSMEAARDMVLSTHSSAKMRSLSSVYNCMGMVFASRRTWVDPEEIQTILEHDEYRQIDRSELERGDVVVYRNNEGRVAHVGIVYGINVNLKEATREVLVLSQWGGDGEYFHSDHDVNRNLGEPTEYWTDRA